MVGNNIPPEYITAVAKGFEEATEKGPLIGHGVQGVRVVLEDGAAHAVIPVRWPLNLLPNTRSGRP